MNRYIEREAVMKTARDGYHSDFGKSMADLTSLREVLEDTPTADVVEVVRCKDCKYWDKVKNPKHAGKGICISPNKSIGGYCTRKGATLENDYCSLGAKKDGET